MRAIITSRRLGIVDATAATIRLTSLAACAGCAGKMGPGDLSAMLAPLAGLVSPQQFPDLLVGLDEPDDAAVWRLDDERAIVSTVDFFAPVVDDPYEFGAIAAANALSDVYAMGGEPLFAINLAAFPEDLDTGILREILRGGAEKVREAGAVVVGGHTITDKEPKYGLAVTGMVHPDRVLTKGGAQVGDALILTKPLGAGVLTTGGKRGVTTRVEMETAIASMSRLNKTAARLAVDYGVRAMTDVTGYGLMGHAHQMALLGKVSFHIRYETLEWLPGARRLARENVFPGGMARNRSFYGNWVALYPLLKPFEQSLLFDPQTSGGLLMAVAPDAAEALHAALRAAGEPAMIIGEVKAGRGEIVVE
jgi:selenide, water dikinase